jgi:colanic acid/amylovoran biosynthesis glycosyltransferase
MTKRTKVLIFTDNFLRNNEAFLVEQARQLFRYRPEFLVFYRIPSKHAQNCSITVNCFRDSARGRFGELLLKGGHLAVPNTVPGLDGCGLIHAHFGANGLLAWPLAKKLGVPLITTFHGHDATFDGNPFSVAGIYNKIFFIAGRRALARNKLTCIAVSDYVAKRLASFGFSPDKVMRHYIGIDTSFFTPAASVQHAPNRIVNVARFTEYKGHRFIVEALGRLADAGHDIELVLVGQGPLRDEVERQARKRIRKVIMLENQSREQIRELVRSARLYIHGSYALENGHAEALGIAILESQAVGTPVVAFDSGGVAEGIDPGRSGFVVPEKDINAMSDAVAKLLLDPNRWQSFSNAGIRFTRTKFDIVRQTRELENIYDMLRAK